MITRQDCLRFALIGALLAVIGCSSDSASQTASGSTNNPSDPSSSAASKDAGAAPLPSTADSGFRPGADGFRFANYADMPGPGVFGGADLRRMFGDKVCSTIANDVCGLTPQGQDWIDKVNASLKGGHCEGFAVLSLLLYKKWLAPTNFGADTTSALAITGNGALNHELAYWYATQFLEDPVITTTRSLKAADAVTYLIQTFAAPSDDTIARIGIARIGPSGAVEGGHAITPYAVLDGDKPNTKKIMVYDSNYPGEERAIAVDLAANSWSYVAGTTPEEPASLYSGDLANKNRLYVAAVHPRLGVHTCPFCGDGPVKAQSASLRLGQNSLIDPSSKHRSLLVNGALDPVVRDADGNRSGRVNGEIVNEIPGAIIMPGFSGGLWADNTPVQIILPASGDLKVSVTPKTPSGAGADAGAGSPSASSVTLFGSGYSLGVDYPAAATVVGDTIGMPSDATGVTLTSLGPSSATLAMAVQTAGGGMVAHIALANLPAGANVGLQTDGASGKVGVKVDSPTPVDLKLDVGIDKGDGTGKQVFEGAVKSTGADKVGVDLGTWTGGTDPMPISVAPSDGSPPKVVVVDNSHDYTPPAVDECAQNLSNCSVNAACTDTPDSFTCTCNKGYTGTGVTCVLGESPPPPPPLAPSISYTFSTAPNVVYTVGKVAVLQPPANAGGKIDAYSVSPALPDGLAFDTRTGAISGTPTTVVAAADYTVTATNVTGSATAILTITVQAPAPQVSYSTPSNVLFRWAAGPSIAPTSTGGMVAEYAIAPPLPAGLAFNTSNGEIRGTPTELSPVTSYTVTASNASGSWPCTLSLGVVCASGSTCDLPPGPTSFTIGGTVISDGVGLVLQDNAGDNLPINASGAFTFPTRVVTGGTYAVTVLTQPSSPAQTCAVTGGTGSVGAASVTNVVVVCTTSALTVGGSVTGLLGKGLVLRNNESLAIAADGSFAFPTKVSSGGAYAVSVLTQPSSPTQTCSVTKGSGTVGGANVSDVAVSCSTTAFTVGGNVSGLVGSGLVLLDDAGDARAVAPNATAFTFGTPIASGGTYAVTIRSNPTGQTCSVSGGSGTVGAGNVTSVVVNCSVNRYTVGGTITGLTGAVVLRNDGGDNLALNSSGSFAFPTSVASGTRYDVTVLTQPSAPSQICTVTGGGTGTVGAADVSSVIVSCATNSFTVGGMVSGLTGTVVLQNDGGDDLALSANGSFSFATPLLSGATYNATVLTQPTYPSSDQTCTVGAPSGTVGGVNATGIAVTCTTKTYTVGGRFVVASGSATIQNNGGSDLVLTGSGSFTFTTPIASGQPYAVTASAPAGETCQVLSSSGTVASANVTGVTVYCGLPSSSCKTLLTGSPGLPSGTYMLDGYQTYCDMTTDGGGWTLVMKLAAGDFCYGSTNWTATTPLNESAMLDATFPNPGAYDATSSAFYLVSDATALRFDTMHGTVTTTFVSPSSAQNLMTMNTVAFAAYPNRDDWRNAFRQDRNQAPIFMRAGVPVTDGNVCRDNPQATPSGCGQLCMFCYQAADGDCCGCAATANDVSSGIGNSDTYCGGGTWTCSTGGSWSDPSERTLVWAR